MLDPPYSFQPYREKGPFFQIETLDLDSKNHQQTPSECQKCFSASYEPSLNGNLPHAVILF